MRSRSRWRRWSSARFGMLLELALRRTYGRDALYGLLLTFGAALVIEEGIRAVFGSTRSSCRLPEAISGAFMSGDLIYASTLFACAFAVPRHRLLWLFLEKTPYGSIIKAGAHDSEMVRALGINLARLRLFVFALGVALRHRRVVMAPIWGIGRTSASTPSCRRSSSSCWAASAVSGAR
jgi:branched-subunit amino acid ABC-type transport system permease component